MEGQETKPWITLTSPVESITHYVQQVRNYKGIQRKNIHFGTRHRIEYTLKTKLLKLTQKRNNVTTITPQRVVPTTWEDREYAIQTG